MEGTAYEEFLLNLMDYQDVVKAKNERWKLMINGFQKQISQGDSIVEQEKEKLQ